jgi:hypothetical protein
LMPVIDVLGEIDFDVLWDLTYELSEKARNLEDYSIYLNDIWYETMYKC